ncbi:MAG: hypothetical protein CM1200mP2_40450 [Planctomycetaceae bacterium]|nr:MAG: hypothetical protein CM1200mP2_40450 [Planctomycetaceae bacterium]
MSVLKGRLITTSLPPAFVGSSYHAALKTIHMAKPLRWKLVDGTLPDGITLDAKTGRLQGVPVARGRMSPRSRSQTPTGSDSVWSWFLGASESSPGIRPDKHTVVLYDWQGPRELIQDRMGESNLP